MTEIPKDIFLKNQFFTSSDTTLDQDLNLMQHFEKAYQQNQEINCILNQLISSPFLRAKQAELFQQKLSEQHLLALNLGSLILDQFNQSSIFSEFTSQLNDVLLTSSFMEGDSNTALSEQDTSKSASLGGMTPQESMPPLPEFDVATIDIQDQQLDQQEKVSLPVQSTLESFEEEVSNLLLTPNTETDSIIAEHTGRSIELSSEYVKPPIDLSPLLNVGFHRSFSEELPQKKKSKKPLTTKERIFKTLQELPAPIEIIQPQHLNEAFSTIQRLADINRMKTWSELNPKLVRALCVFIVNYTQYVFHKPLSLRPNGMTGDNSYINVINRIASYIKKQSIEPIHGLKKTDEARHGSWFNDVTNSYYNLQEALNIELKSYVKLNADRQIAKLKQLIQEDRNTDDIENLNSLIVSQVKTILNQTDASHSDIRLIKLLVNYQEALEEESLFKKLRSAIRKYEKDIEEQDNSQVSQDEVFEKLANKKIVLVGGDRRHDATMFLESILPKSTKIDWPDFEKSNGSKSRISLEKSIAKGGVNAVIIIQKFIGHDVTTPLKSTLKEHSHCASAMSKTYSKAQLHSALELIVDQL